MLHTVLHAPYRMQVTEQYDLAKPTKVMRRDLRPGDATTTAERLESGIKVVAAWKGQLAGELEERYELRYATVSSTAGSTAGGTTGGTEVELAVTSTIRIGGRSESATQVYRRQAGVTSREAFVKVCDRVWLTERLALFFLEWSDRPARVCFWGAHHAARVHGLSCARQRTEAHTLSVQCNTCAHARCLRS